MATTAPSDGAGGTNHLPIPTTTGTCPNCHHKVRGLAHRYRCQNCNCLFSENPADKGVPPIFPRST